MRDLIDRAFIDLANLTVREDAEEGQGLVEYGLIISLVALAAIGTMFLLGDKISTMFTSAGASLK